MTRQILAVLPNRYGRLYDELNMCPIVGKQRKVVEDFLQAVEIDTLQKVDVDTLTDYHRYVAARMDLSEMQKRTYKSSLEQCCLAYLRSEAEMMEEEVSVLGGDRARKNKLLMFLLVSGIRRSDEITYKHRCAYVNYLKETVAQKKWSEHYKLLDNLKLNAIRKDCEKNSLKKRELSYANEVFFLQYHPDIKIAESFYYTCDKEELVFDFSLDASTILKRQVFKMLNYILREKSDRHDRRERFLLPLKKFYLFCVKYNIADVEQILHDEVEVFRAELRETCGGKVSVYFQIVDNFRKYLFLSASSIRWNATVWYLDRMNFKQERINPAREIKTFAFDKIRITSNRNAFQIYMKYVLAVSERATLQTIRGRYYDLLDFLTYCENKEWEVANLTEEKLREFLEQKSEEYILPATYNRALCSVAMFLNYLCTKELIYFVPIVFSYYFKPSKDMHKDRAMTEEVWRELLAQINTWPEDVALMQLTLQVIGPRINEVCALRGDAFEWDGKDAWIRVYQNKMKSEKRIPIPKYLYEVMYGYIEMQHIRPDEYVFKNSDGGPYSAATFTSKVKSLLEGTEVGDKYQYKSHDFRHKIATWMYQGGVKLGTIREYHGHRNEDMTARYVDYMPELVTRENRKFLEMQRQKGFYDWEKYTLQN